MFDALLRRRGIQIINSVTPVIQRFTHAESTLVPTQSNIKALISSDRHRKKKVFKKHFIENLYINEFQNDIVEYPEIETMEEVESLFNECKFGQNVLTDSSDENELVHDSEAKKVLSKIKKFGLSGFKLSKTARGFGYMDSEYLCMQEILSNDLSLSKTVSENEEFGIQLIKLFANDSQKDEYLFKLASGEIMTCFAHLESEPLVTLDQVSVNTTATLSPDGENYIISGKKNWVYNASHADVIITSATVDGEENGKPTLFLIDKNTEGVQIHKPIQLSALKGVEVCEVSFNEVKVPSKNILGAIHEGDKLIRQILTNGKLSNGAQCIGAMRKLIDTAIKHCIHNKFFKKNKYERNLYESKIGEMVGQLYTVESMAYLMAGRVDCFDNADVFLESLIVKIFASEALQYVLQQTIQILGSKAYENDQELNKLITDCQFFAGCDATNDYLKVTLSTSGCKYILKHKENASIIQKFRSIVNRQMVHKIMVNDPYVMNRKKLLRGYLHLYFQFESDMLEDCVFHLKETTNRLFKKYGDDILKKEEILKMLADMVICIYVMTATLARASRAFCLAVKRQDVDDLLAQAQVASAFYKFRRIRDTLNKSSELELFKKIDLDMLQSKGYSQMYPVTSCIKVRR